MKEKEPVVNLKTEVPEGEMIVRNPIFVYIFEVTNILGCLIYTILIFANVGAMFFPKGVFSPEDLLQCSKAALVVTIVVVLLIGIPILLLFVDNFVIMKGVKHFKLSIISILMLPGAYPIIRTRMLREEKKTQAVHVAAGSAVIVCHVLIIIAVIYYMIRMTVLLRTMMGV